MAKTAVCQGSGIREFTNTTQLDTQRLQRMCLGAVAGWRLDGVTVRVRYSKGADFSGTCCYRSARIYVNLGRHLSYPYQMGTHLARAKSQGEYWWKPIFTIELPDAFCLVLFVFLHECFHLLVKRARRNTRQKESMCDRFAARFLVDHYQAVVCDESDCPVTRESWDFQDLDRFAAAARRPIRAPRPVRPAACNPTSTARQAPPLLNQQLLLFDL